MSQFGGNENVNINLRVTGQAETQQELSAANQQVEKLNKTADSGADLTVKGFKKSVAAVRTFVGAIASAIGVATAFFVLGQKINKLFTELFTSGESQAKKFLETINSADPKEKLGAVAKEIEQLQGVLSRRLGFFDQDPLANLFIGRRSVIEGQLKTLRESAASNAQQLKAKERDINQSAIDDQALVEAEALRAQNEKDADATLERIHERERQEHDAAILLQAEVDAEFQETKERIEREADAEIEAIRRIERARQDAYRDSRLELERLIEAQRGLSDLQAAFNLATVGQGVEIVNLISRRVGRR